MPDKIALCTPDGRLVFEVPAGALCQWFAGCAGPAVQMRRHAVLNPVPVCERHTNRADWFASPASVHMFDVPDVGTVAVVFGDAIPPLGYRAYRVVIDGVIEVERQDYPDDGTHTASASGVVAIGAVAQLALYAGSPWRAPLAAWAEKMGG